MRKIKVGDIIKVIKKDIYVEGLFSIDKDNPNTYTTKFKVLQTNRFDSAIQVELLSVTGTWWFNVVDVTLVSNKNIIGGELC